ncbi:hypothetical protein E1298_17150 [Actinomadura rubrisoli]|uniref:EfeO-type cupredoxin-like domain-containing protein n=2 Tax=Actinomadura rubrisoli TaxID=2530368 RepID=A0A4R5BJ30_9ACTN|nr:hypothetical protein E1298_17150 [Actinomadura rubrisoli]
MVVACAVMGAVMAAAGCGEPAAEPGAPASAAPSAQVPAGSPTALPPGDKSVTSVTATVTKGKVRIAGHRVKVPRGATVRITITSDAADEFHLHGYDRELELAPGKPATLQLTADIPGVFEAELHHSGARVFELQVG